MMTHGRYRVKSSRKSPRPPGPFGDGILRPASADGEIVTAEDVARAMEAFAAQRRREQAADGGSRFVELMDSGWRF